MLGQTVQPVQDEHFLAALGQCCDAELQVIDNLAMRDGFRHIRRLHIGPGAVGQPGIGMGLARALSTVAVDGAMGGDMPQERQRLHDLASRRALQQLHANVLQDVAGEVAVAKAPAHLIDQFVVVTQQRRE